MGHENKRNSKNNQDRESIKSIKFICFEDLVEAFKNAGNPIAHDKLKKLVKWQNVISIQDAKKIFDDQTGEKLNLNLIKYDYNYYKDVSNQINKETNETLNSSIPSSNLIDIQLQLEEWYENIEKMNEGYPRASILGIVCSGGFLQGEQTIDNAPFIFPLQLGINILIGDRGSGKSTTLDMLSLLVNSFMLQTQDDNEWETQEHNISEWIVSEQKNFYTTGHRRVLQTLKKRSVKKYACYFYKKQNTENEKDNQRLYVFYADIETNYWHLFYREQNSWSQSLENPMEVFPEMLILRQGDIVQIVQNENKLVINQVLEGLNFRLKQQRLKLSQLFDLLAKEYINLKEIEVIFSDRQIY